MTSPIINTAAAIRLAARECGVTVSQLAAECGITRPSAHSILTRLMLDGELCRTGRVGRHGHTYWSKESTGVDFAISDLHWELTNAACDFVEATEKNTGGALNRPYDRLKAAAGRFIEACCSHYKISPTDPKTCTEYRGISEP